VDGKPARLDPDGTLSVLAGTHVLHAEHAGFDPGEATFAVGAGASLDLPLRLSPNARSVLVQAEPAGAEVLLDGQPVGKVEVPAQGGLPALLLPDLPLGEHAFEVRSSCHRSAHAEELLNVDLLDRSPKHLGPFRLEKAEGTLAVTGLEGATLSVDGARKGLLPMGPFAACAGPRLVEVDRGGRRLWSGTVEVHEGEPQPVTLAARPNLCIEGSDPPPWAEAWNVGTRCAQADVVWSGKDARPTSVDGVIPPDAPLLHGPPVRQRLTLGVGLADGERFGAARIVRVRPEGPAARAGVRPGERIVALQGKPVRTAAEAEAALAGASAEPLELTLEGGAGETRKLRVTPTLTPVLPAPPADPAQAALRAAWAAAESAARPDDVAAAADLVLSLAAAGRTEDALAAWRGRTWPARSGISGETVAYFLGRALQAGGDAGDGAKALAEAAASHATAESDDGPPVASAARSP